MSEAGRQRESARDGDAIETERVFGDIGSCLGRAAIGCAGAALVAALLLVAAVLLTGCEGTSQDWKGPVLTGPQYAGTVTVYQARGPSHCGWDTVTFLVVPTDIVPGRERIDERLRSGDWLVYVNSSDMPALAGTFLARATLPPDAQRSEYNKGSTELWFAASDGGAYAYLIRGKRVERWPRFDSGCD